MNGNASSGIEICGVLLIVFIVLKLCGVIKWSWIWVLSPLWIPVLVAVLAFVFATLFAVLVFALAVFWSKKW